MVCETQKRGLAPLDHRRRRGNEAQTRNNLEPPHVVSYGVVLAIAWRDDEKGPACWQV